MSPSTTLSLLAAAAVLLGPCRGQEPQHVGYPERDALSPFRRPVDVYAPPDELFRVLRAMQTIADRPGAATSFDADGREIVDDEGWRALRADAMRIGVDGAYLAQILRLHKNVADRGTALYGMFWSDNVDHVLDLIAHIPGEPERALRERALPRAIEYLRVHLRRRFGDLGDEHKQALLDAMPEPGSPVARSRGITRLPVDADHLHDLRVVPFLQLLDQPAALDQAQALWFLAQVFELRPDLAQRWLEPSLPRVRQLLTADDENVRDQAIALFAAIGPRDLAAAPLDDPRALQTWADAATKVLFPPIRNLNDALVQIHPSPERDALAAAATEALETSAIGDPFSGRRADGTWYRGFRVVTVPEALRPLSIPPGAVITTVNGVAVEDAQSLLRTVRQQLTLRGHPRTLFVEYLQDDKPHAVEYRLL